MKKQLIFVLILFIFLTGLFAKENKKKKTINLSAKTSFSENPIKRKKKLGRATLEFFGLMGYWQTRYWIVYTDYIEDWQFEFTLKDQTKKLFTSEGYRLDSNCYSLNWLHSIAGAGFYTVARSNYYGWLKSLLFSTLGSAYWEYIVEWREVISFNDMIITPIGGLSFGESMFQTSNYYSGKGGFINKILSFVTSPISRLNKWFDRKAYPITRQEIGWGKFDILLGYEKTSGNDSDRENNSLFNFSFDNKQIIIPEYGKSGKYNENIKQTLYSKLNFSFSYGKHGVERFSIFTKAIFLGLFDQSINNNHKGYSMMLGLASRFDFFKKRGKTFYDSCDVEVDDGKLLKLESPRAFTDKYTVVNIAGPVLNYTFFNRNLRLKFEIEGYFDHLLSINILNFLIFPRLKRLYYIMDIIMVTATQQNLVLMVNIKI